MNQAPRDVQEMAQATGNNDLEAVRRILSRGPNLSHCLDGYSRDGGDEDLTILKMLLAAGADINDCSFGEPLLHSSVHVIADEQGSRYGREPNWGEVGRLIELGADPRLRDGTGSSILDVAERCGERASLEAYLRSLGINLNW